jgi:hypothetical protein
VVADRLRALPARYDSLDAAISPAIERDRVHAVEYFDPTHDAHGNTCPALVGFTTTPEVEWARSHVLEPLNKAFADAAARHGWREVTGVAQLFGDHGYCARSQAWVTTLSQSFIHLGGRFKGRILGTLHPNEAGHEHTGELIATALERQFYPGVTLTAVPKPPEPPASEGGGLSALAIAGIVVGGLLLLAGAGVLGFLLARRSAH